VCLAIEIGRKERLTVDILQYCVLVSDNDYPTRVGAREVFYEL
jgi:hypothetical protein